MSETFHVDGLGSSRDAALNYADDRASEYFGLPASELSRIIGRAEIGASLVDGTPIYYTVAVEYQT